MRLPLWIAFCLIAPLGCQPEAQPAPAGDSSFVRTELYFGLSRANQPDISGKQFADFLAEVVTPRFPDGLTVVDAAGQWRDPSGTIEHEPSKLLILIYTPSPSREDAIELIRTQYKKRFGEESVLRVTEPVRANF